MQVKDIFTKDIYSITPDDNLVHAAQAMKRHNVGILPVVRDDRLLGVITDRDICVEAVSAACDPHQCLVRDYMTAEPITIAPEASLEEAANLMAQHQVRRLPVTDQGRLLGMVSLGDLAVNCVDNGVLANTLRKLSQPVRSEMHAATGAQTQR